MAMQLESELAADGQDTVQDIYGFGSQHRTKTTESDNGITPQPMLTVHPKIAAVSTATPKTSYSQEEVLQIFDVTDRRIRSVFLNGGIERRFLSFPRDENGGPRTESQGALLARHRECGLDIAAEALQGCLGSLGANIHDVAYLCCVTTTGFLTPTLSALLSRKLNMRLDCGRLDVVGMGCNAGLNGLTATATWAKAHPGRLAVMVCVEVCSAAYVRDESMATSVVNSLFGDGAGAAAVIAGNDPKCVGPNILKFGSYIIPDSLHAMRFDWDDECGKFSFFLDRDIPYLIGAHSEKVIGGLLHGSGLRRRDIVHWVVHSGGKKVIDAVKMNLGLSNYDLRHTIGVLRDYGNLSSGSFLFSLDRLLGEGVVKAGDYGILMTMGPGATIETALVRW